MGRRTTSKAKQSVTKQVKYTIDCTHPIEDGLLEGQNFQEYLASKIKVDGKAGNLGQKVKVTRDENVISVTVKGTPFAKRYLKYLTKKYLKKQELRDWLHVIATSKNAYELKYFNIAQQGEEKTEH
eukprot:GEZU01032597.1.p3 GENE.GEZU01032597.1~~GEZU01032597.1.p3  ORF type:complete len:146 (-),score=58.77 GEZU01032597.1:1631-2008(-)